MITSVNNIQTTKNVSFTRRAKNNQIYNNPYAQPQQKEEKKKSKFLLWLMGIGAALMALAKFGAKKDEVKTDDGKSTNEHGDTFVKNNNDEVIVEEADELVDTDEDADTTPVVVPTDADEIVDNADEVVDENPVVVSTDTDEVVDENPVVTDVDNTDEVVDETPVVVPTDADEVIDENPVVTDVDNADEVVDENPVVVPTDTDEVIDENPVIDNEDDKIVDENLDNLPEEGQISLEHTHPEVFEGMEEVVPAAVVASTVADETIDEVDPNQMTIDDIKTKKKRTYKPKTDEQRSREVQKKANEILEKSSQIVVDAKSDFEYAHGIIRETKKIGRQAQKQGYADIVNPDGSVVKFNTTTEKGETILNNIVEYDAEGNLIRKSNLHEGMIWSVMAKNPETGKVDIVEVDREGVLLAKVYENNGENYTTDKIFNFTFVDRAQEGELSTGKLTEYAENLVVQENYATIAEAYRFGEDEIVDEFATGVRVKADNIGSTRGVYKFDDTTIQEKAKTYKGSLVGAEEGTGTGVYRFENGKFVAFKDVAAKTTDVIAD